MISPDDRIPLPCAPDRIPFPGNPPPEQRGFIDAFLWGPDKVPVLIRKAGLYPEALLPAGTTTGDEPHVLVSIGGGSVNGVAYHAGYTVQAVGRYVGGRRRLLSVANAPDFPAKERHAEPGPLVEKALAHLPAAAALLPGIDAAYEAAAARIGALQKYPRQFETRDAYEAACAAEGVERFPDDKCSTWGEFTFPHYSAEQCVTYGLMQRRGSYLEAQREAARAARLAELARRPARPPQMEGQLWQECERCGREPSYLPLMVCEACWPKGRGE